MLHKIQSVDMLLSELYVITKKHFLVMFILLLLLPFKSLKNKDVINVPLYGNYN